MRFARIHAGLRRCVLALLSTTPVWYLRSDAILAFAAVWLVVSWPWTGVIEMPRATLSMLVEPTPSGTWVARTPTSTNWFVINLEITEAHGTGWVARTIRKPTLPRGAMVTFAPNPPPPLAPPASPFALWLSLIDSGQSGGLYSMSNGSPAGWERVVIADLARLESQGRPLPGTGGGEVTRIEGVFAHTLTMIARYLPIVLAGLAALLWFLRAVQRADYVQRVEDSAKGICPNCGYTKEGLAWGAACPECGCDPGQALVEGRAALGMTGGKGSS